MREGCTGPLRLATPRCIDQLIQLDYDEIAHSFGSGISEVDDSVDVLLMAVALFWLDRQEKAYLWLAIVSTVTLLGTPSCFR